MAKSDRTAKGTSRQGLYMKNLLENVRVLEQMLAQDMIESDIHRIGAEQEVVLIDKSFRPATLAADVLARLNDPHFTDELALFNLEFNLDPLVFSQSCLSEMENQLNRFFDKLCKAANEHNAEAILTGILPTFVKSDLELRNVTPKPRYFELDNTLKRLRGGKPIQFEIRGIDDLFLEHDSIMLEACNTSFQVHFQVHPAEFARYHNIAQAVAGPVLAVAVNSPMLLGKRLWKETRISVFQETIDTRSAGIYPRDLEPRVSFGTQWVENSVVEIYQEDIARFRAFFWMDVDENATELLKQGIPPKLQALQLFNGSVYRWMRPCYGLTNGKAHLRIENRVFPAGPTICDEVANAAFWLGLVYGIADEFDDITKMLDFKDAKANFFSAASQGMEAQFTWLNNKIIPANRLICKHLLPLARNGLTKAGVSDVDIDRFLGIIEKRAKSGKTGARWILDSFDAIKNTQSPDIGLCAITAGAWNRSKKGDPVHTWSLARLDEAGSWKSSYQRVEQCMDTEVCTVGPDEPIDLVASLMVWRRISHVPVEDHNHQLLGVVSYRTMVKLLVRCLANEELQSLPVSSVMTTNPVTVTPDDSVLRAIQIMKENKIASLPVVKEGRLVGLITEHSFLNVARELLEIQLQKPD